VRAYAQRLSICSDAFCVPLSQQRTSNISERSSAKFSVSATFPLPLGEGRVRAYAQRLSICSDAFCVPLSQQRTSNISERSSAKSPVGPHPNPLPRGEGTRDPNPLPGGEGTRNPNPLPGEREQRGRASWRVPVLYWSRITQAAIIRPSKKFYQATEDTND
jgi:hypothetical protein